MLCWAAEVYPQRGFYKAVRESDEAPSTQYQRRLFTFSDNGIELRLPFRDGYSDLPARRAFPLAIQHNLLESATSVRSGATDGYAIVSVAR